MFTTKLVEGYDIGPDNTKVSIATFGGGSQTTVMGFDTLRGSNLNMQTVKDRITGITNTRHLDRYIDQALNFANNQMFNISTGMRDDTKISRVNSKYHCIQCT